MVTLEFDIALVLPMVENFLYEQLPRILALPLDQVPWHYHNVCATCEFAPRCSAAAGEHLP